MCSTLYNHILSGVWRVTVQLLRDLAYFRAPKGINLAIFQCTGWVLNRRKIAAYFVEHTVPKTEQSTFPLLCVVFLLSIVHEKINEILLRKLSDVIPVHLADNRA